MSDKNKPLLLLSESVRSARQKLGGGPSQINIPGHLLQIGRLKPRFESLAHTAMTLRDTPGGVEIEKVLVFQTVGTVEGFKKAAIDIGLHWLGERDKDDIKPDDAFYDLKNKGRELGGRVYMAFSNLQALGNIKSLFETYKQNPEEPREEHIKWYELFKYLADIRSWGPEDRLKDTGLAEQPFQGHFPRDFASNCAVDTCGLSTC